MKLFHGIKTWSVAMVAVLCTPAAYASSCNGITDYVGAMWQREMGHLSYHADMFGTMILTGDYRLFWVMQVCSTKSILSTLFFSVPGWIVLGLMIVLAPRGWRLLKRHSQLLRPRLARI